MHRLNAASAPQSSRSSLRLFSALRWLALLIPFFGTLWLVRQFSVNLPYSDQWNQLPGLFLKVHNRQATLADFFAFSWEHRIFFPKLIWTALAFSTHWDVRYETYASVLLVLLTLLAIWSIASSRVSAMNSPQPRFLAHFLASVVLFSLVQYENWLWGFQLAFFLVQLAGAAAIWSLYATQWPAARKFLAACVFCLIATFSSAQGLTSWLALVPCVVFIYTERKKRIAATTLWIALFLLAALIYFHGWSHQARQTSVAAIVHAPLGGLLFFLTTLGSPLGHAFPEAAGAASLIFGSVVLAWLLLCLCEVWREKSFAAAAPWLSLCFFSLGFDAILTIGRSDMGAESALLSRYTTGQVFILVGLIYLSAEMCDRVRWQRTFYEVCSLLFVLLMLAAGHDSFRQSAGLQRQRATARECLELWSYMDPAYDRSPEGCLFPALPFTWSPFTIHERMPLLVQAGLRAQPAEMRFVEQENSQYGEFQLKRQSETVELAGWISPLKKSEPNLVLVSYDDRKTFVTGTLTEAAEASRQSWKLNLPANLLPADEKTLKVWVYDSAPGAFLRLANEAASPQTAAQ